MLSDSLAHSSILPCLGYFQTHSSLYIVLDYCIGGDLAKFMTKYELSTRDCKNVVAQIASALAHLQQHNIAHRDVKTENVLVASSSNEQLQVKLGDFGYAIHCPSSDLRSTLCGTLACLPPEMLTSNAKQYRAMHVDAWSLGILTYELVLQEPLFAWPGNTHDMKEQIRRFCDTSLHVPGSTTFANFVSSLLMRNPSSRMTPCQALEHSWLTYRRLAVEGKGKGAKRCRLD
jgi:serine/threonine protein kinase